MDGGNWRPAQQEAADWRLHLSLDSRNRIVNKILDTLKKHLPISGPDGLGELQKIAVRFEEKIYAAATSQIDYLRRISVKMLTMETKSQSGVANSSSMGGQIPSDPGSNSMQSQMRNQGQQQLPMTMVNQSQTHPQMLPQNSIPSAAGQNSASLSATMSSMTGLTQTGMTNLAGQNANLSSNMGGVSQNSNSNSLVGQGVQPNAFANAQRQQQLQGSQQQSQNSQQQYNMYQQQQQQQLRNQFLKQKIQQQQQQQQSQQHQGNMQSSMLHTHLQQQQNQLQGSQQSLMQMASGHPSTQALQQPSPSMMQTVPQSGLQQNQQAQSVLHQHQQSFMRQQQQTQQSSAHHQQQSQLIGQQPNTHGIQQMLGQQQTVVQDMQQQMQQRLLGSPGNLANIQQPLQPSIHGQQSSISTLTQQQQLSGQNNLAGGQQQQQQQLSHQGNLSNIQLHQFSMHMMQQAKSAASQQQSNQQAPSAVLPSQGQQQSQTLSHHQKLMSQLQSQSLQLPQQMALQQQQPQANSIAVQPRMQPQSNLLQVQNNIEQQKLLFQAQRGLPEASSTSLDSTAQTGLPPDWQEEAYQKLKIMKEMYYTDLSDLFNKITSRCQMYDAQAQGKQIEQMDKLKMFRSMLERLLHCLNLPKSGISPGFKEKLPVYDKQIINVLSSHRIKKPPLLQQGQQPNSPGVIPLSSMPQQPMVQMSQLQQHDNLVNPMQPMSIQSSATTRMSMPLTTNMGAPHAQQMLNSVQPAQNLDQTHGNAMSSSLQNVMVSLQQNSLTVAQQGGMSTIPQGVNLLQPNMYSLQSNPNIIQHQQLKQQDQHKQQQQLMQNQQLKQQFSQRHMQRQIIQQQQKQILMQQQLQQQQLIQQTQPKQVPSVLVQANTFAVGTLGMSASPLLAEYTGVDGRQAHAAVAGKASAADRPLNRLLKSVRRLFFNCCLGDQGTYFYANTKFYGG